MLLGRQAFVNLDFQSFAFNSRRSKSGSAGGVLWLWQEVFPLLRGISLVLLTGGPRGMKIQTGNLQRKT